MDPEFIFDDGGREAAGFKGFTGDCVIRAISITYNGTSYREIYDEIHERQKHWLANTKAGRRQQLLRPHITGSPRQGVYKEVYKPLLADLGYEWTPTMGIGTGCTVHVTPLELPDDDGRYILSVSRHLTTWVDGAMRDIHADVSRGGERCVYGWWRID